MPKSLLIITLILLAIAPLCRGCVERGYVQPGTAEVLRHEGIMAAMMKMGPRKEYRIVKRLEVKVNGEWQRLRYDNK